MRFRLSSLVKLVAACAFVLAFWRLTGWTGVVAVSSGYVLVGLPIVLTRIGRRLGDPILSGLLGGGLAWACWAVVLTAFAPFQRVPNALLLMPPLGMMFGAIYGNLVYFRDSARGRVRRGSRRLAYRYDLVLFLFLVAAVSLIPVVDEVRWSILPRTISLPFLQLVPPS